MSSYRRFLTAKSSAEERSFWRRKMAPAKRGHFIYTMSSWVGKKFFLTHSLVVPRTSLDRSKIVYHLRVCFFGSYRGDVDRARRFFSPDSPFFFWQVSLGLGTSSKSADQALSHHVHMSTSRCVSCSQVHIQNLPDIGVE